MSIHNMSMMRSSRYLQIRLSDGQCIGKNLLIGQERVLPFPLIALLASISSHVLTEKIREKLKDLFPKTPLVDAAIANLLEAGILVLADSDLDVREKAFAEWVWGDDTAAHFLATRRLRWMDEESEVRQYARLLKSKTAPPLWEDVESPDFGWTPLGIDLRVRSIFELFDKRRSLRQFSDQPLEAESLGAILCAGLGIQKFLKLPMRLVHPLRFSPSPGGLNAFYGYILAKNIKDTPPGVYVYNALRNQIKKINSIPDIKISMLFGNQSWADEAAAICVLCADYKKMSWKYSDQSAFNSLLIESGHIAQNMMLCAASLSIGSVPTNAVDQVKLEKYFSLEFPRRVVLYAVAFGREDLSRSKDHYSPATLAALGTLLEIPDMDE